MQGFKTFFENQQVNPGAFVSYDDPSTFIGRAKNLPDDYLELPTVTKTVTVFKIIPGNKNIQIIANPNFTWWCPTESYRLLQRKGTAPYQGDKVQVTYYPFNNQVVSWHKI